MIKLLPWHQEALQGILDCDLIGFHVKDYCLNFVDCCRRALAADIEYKTDGSYVIKYKGRQVRVYPLPISIPFDRFEELSKTSEGLPHAENIQVSAHI